MAGTAPVGRDVGLPAACRDIVRLVDEELARFLREHREPTAAPGVARAFDELERVILAGGKRLRPVFCVLGHRAAGGRSGPEIIRVASALELLHTFAIVHDDVMDGSRTRRGAPASWVELAEAHRREGLRGDPDSYGISAAVLVGDLAMILADQAFLASAFPPERLFAALLRYHRMRTEMVTGQYLDVLAANRGASDEAEARRVAVLKSGLYTVEGPLHIGAILAGGRPELLAVLSGYGVALGEAFQLRDDVLGVFGDPQATGKDRDSDLREGKRTVLVARTMAAVSGEDRRFLEERLGREDLTEPEVERIRSLMESSGALASTLALIDELAARAKSALGGAPLPDDVAGTLAELADVLALRPA